MLVPEKDRLFRIFQVKVHTVVVDLDDIHNVVHITHTALSRKTGVVILSTEKDRQKVVQKYNNASTNQYDYVVERIISHETDWNGTKHLARWHGFSHAGYVLELPKHIRQHFIEQCWRLRKCTQKDNTRESVWNEEERE